MPQAKKVTKKTPAKTEAPATVPVGEPVPEPVDPGQPVPAPPPPEPPAAPVARKIPGGAISKPKKAKAGANFRDRNLIAQLAAAGLGVDEIAMKLNIKDEVVRAFLPKAESVDALTE